MSRLLALILLCAAACGCELIADFDRSKIPDEPGPDAGAMGDAAAQPDAGGDSGPDEDAGMDEDAGADEDAG